MKLYQFILPSLEDFLRFGNAFLDPNDFHMFLRPSLGNKADFAPQIVHCLIGLKLEFCNNARTKFNIDC